jgi:hypothetical protein
MAASRAFGSGAAIAVSAAVVSVAVAVVFAAGVVEAPCSSVPRVGLRRPLRTMVRSASR